MPRCRRRRDYPCVRAKSRSASSRSSSTTRSARCRPSRLLQRPRFKHTLHSVHDGFAINYGTGGIGAEILANRLGRRPDGELHRLQVRGVLPELLGASAIRPWWSTSRPTSPCTRTLDAGRRRRLRAPSDRRPPRRSIPDDPSNVYHSYIGDHVKFRDRCTRARRSTTSTTCTRTSGCTRRTATSRSYLDSQAIGPGLGVHRRDHLQRQRQPQPDGRATRSSTATSTRTSPQGMWALWRVHDVFEAGTELDADGRPAAGARALPDGEIAAGTPIPAVVPLPDTGRWRRCPAR